MQKRRLEIRAEEVSKEYDLRPVLKRIGFELGNGAILGITGRNGSGKSTLMKILANVLELTSGTVEWHLDGKPLADEELPRHLGYVAPYLQLYTEFTPREHLDILSDIRGYSHDRDYADGLFRQFGLADRMDDTLSSYSSGMLQRVKYILALSHRPAFLFLDEPMTNLDERGIGSIRDLILREAPDRITLVATNDADDLTLCTHRLALNPTAAPHPVPEASEARPD